MKRAGKFAGILFWAILVGAFAAELNPNGALAKDPSHTLDPTVGDEDPFPLACVDFSGSWKSDAGDNYAIQQKQCSQIKIAMSSPKDRETMTIVPDNRTRPGPLKGSQIRHSWNSSDNATVLEIHRTYSQNGAQITEVITFEQASDKLLLQTRYRTIDFGGSMPPKHEYDQMVFRRVSSK